MGGPDPAATEQRLPGTRVRHLEGGPPAPPPEPAERRLIRATAWAIRWPSRDRSAKGTPAARDFADVVSDGFRRRTGRSALQERHGQNHGGAINQGRFPLEGGPPGPPFRRHLGATRAIPAQVQPRSRNAWRVPLPIPKPNRRKETQKGGGLVPAPDGGGGLTAAPGARRAGQPRIHANADETVAEAPRLSPAGSSCLPSSSPPRPKRRSIRRQGQGRRSKQKHSCVSFRPSWFAGSSPHRPSNPPAAVNPPLRGNGWRPRFRLSPFNLQLPGPSHGGRTESVSFI